MGLKIDFYCGDSIEEFSPKSIERGAGGSEEAVIYLSKELAALGHKVTVWNNCGEAAGEYDGVTYVDYLDYDSQPTDIFISWRTENNLKYAKGFKLAYHWLHDTIDEERVFRAMELGANKIMVLSKFHRRLYPKIRNEEIFLTQNGVDLNQFDSGAVGIGRVPGRVFYGSSYDRGLKEFLEEWPKIKLAVPWATLHIAYGWQTWEAIAKANDSLENFERIKESLEDLMQQDGITHLGRISHKQVAREMMEADVWGYPTWWPEISCITAMKAQLAGAIPVVIPTAAVAETVQYGYKTDRGYYMDIHGNPAVRGQETLDQWTQKMIYYLATPENEKQQLREDMMVWASKQFDWKNVAKKWEKEFKSELMSSVIRKRAEETAKGYADAV